MPIAFKCSKCSSQYRVKDKLAGKKTKCPKCSTILRIPTPGAKKPAASKPPAPPKAADPFIDDDPLGLGLSTSTPGDDIFKSDPATPGNSAPAAAPADDGFWSQTSGPSTKKSNDPLAEAPVNPYSSPASLPGVGSYLPKSSSGGGNREAAKKKLAIPTLAARGVVGLTCVFSVIGLLRFFYVATQLARIENLPPGVMNGVVGYIIGVVIAIGIQIFTITALNHAREMESKGMAWAGFILAMTPCASSFFFIFAVPFCIWGMIVLAKSDVSRSFRH